MEIEKLSERELQEMQEIAKAFVTHRQPSHIVNNKTYNNFKDICKIALIEINRELDERKIRKEITK